MTSTGLISDSLPWEPRTSRMGVFDAPGLPVGHPSEPDTFVRQLGVPGHDQDVLSRVRVLMVGAGGLGSWVGLALARSGLKRLTVVDPDRFDRTNAHRQLMYADDLGASKAAALARNLVPHMIAGGSITAHDARFQDVVEDHDLGADVVLALVDNNRCRYEVSRWARTRRIPAVFAMLSLDGTRVHAFLQGPRSDDGCLWCALPNLNIGNVAPCASATIDQCLQAATVATFFALRAVMGWPDGAEQFNWSEQHLLSPEPHRKGVVPRRRECHVCGQ